MNDKTKAGVRNTYELVVKIAFCFTITTLLAAIFLPWPTRSRDSLRRSTCQSNLKHIALSVRQYTEDYDRRFPLVATSKPRFGWADALVPYLNLAQVYQCPAEQNSPQPDPTQPQYTDYWFNARVSQKNQTQISQPMRMILLGEGNDGTDMTDARYHLLQLPAKWRGDETSPLYRHLGGANFAFADGHVKWYQAKIWENNVSLHRGATFLLGSGKVKN